MKGICRERVLSSSFLNDLLTLIRFYLRKVSVLAVFLPFLLSVADYGRTVCGE